MATITMYSNNVNKYVLSHEGLVIIQSLFLMEDFMFNKFKEYREYRRNKKVVKKEFITLASDVLPLMSKITGNALQFINFATYVMNECNTLSGEDLANRLQEIINDSIKTFADKFETDETRLYEIIQYIATLDKDDIQKIITEAQVETLHTED